MKTRIFLKKHKVQRKRPKVKVSSHNVCRFGYPFLLSPWGRCNVGTSQSHPLCPPHSEILCVFSECADKQHTILHKISTKFKFKKKWTTHSVHFRNIQKIWEYSHCFKTIKITSFSSELLQLQNKKTRNQQEHDLRPMLVPTTFAVLGICSFCP